MWPLLIFVIGLILLIVGPICSKIIPSSKRYSMLYDNLDNGYKIITIVGILVMVVGAIALVISVFSYGDSLDRVAKMENFYDHNYQIIETASKSYTNAVEVKTSENTVTTVTISKEFVDQVAEYNEYLTWYRKYQHHWFYAWFVTVIPDRLNYIELPKLDTIPPFAPVGITVE